jgi:hypothetical protein
VLRPGLGRGPQPARRRVLLQPQPLPVPRRPVAAGFRRKAAALRARRSPRTTRRPGRERTGRARSRSWLSCG